MKVDQDFVGTGWAFPIQLTPSGGIAMVSRERELEEAMRIVLLTYPGERPMRPEFGCRVHELVFAPNDATTEGLAIYYVEEALAMWEPRIEVLSVRANPDASAPERLLIEIEYEIKATYDRRALVFPFYRIPGE